jgi:alanine racemase
MNHNLYGVKELTEFMNARAIIRQQQALVRTLLTDSRKLHDHSKGLFFALHARRDGHSFIREVYESGLRSFVISDPDFEAQDYPEANFYQVKDTLKALQDLAAKHRSEFHYPVIGITGSNGKTIVKEWLYHLLLSDYNIIRSPKSYNSQIGVPVSVWEMGSEHDLAIFEAGVSKAGEMNALARIINPTIGILTNIGEAHKEGFSSVNEKISEKLKLFSHAGLLIYSDKYLEGYTGDIPGKDKFKWGMDASADLFIISDEKTSGNGRIIYAKFRGKDIQARIPFSDQASIENCIICWATMLALGYEPDEAALRLGKLIPISMRLEMKNGINNCSVIDDSYSLDLSSLAIALDFLKQQNQHRHRTLILSDIPGPDSEAVYEQVRHLLETKSVSRLIAIGPKIGKYVGNFNCEVELFGSTADFLNRFSTLRFQNETILLKGARAFEFENISRLLTQKVHETVLEINLNALENNLNYYKSLLGTETRIMAMVKAFSYGSGSFEIANLLEFNKVDYLAVAYADEGVSLRNAGCTLPIMVMSPDALAFETIIQHKLEPEIYSVRILNEFEELLNRKNLEHYPVHIKLDTGMHRLGFMEDEMDELLSFLRESRSMRVQTVFSHLVASEDEAHDSFTLQQIDLFERMSDRLSAGLSYSFLRHLANTSGISRWPEARFDMVRLGIGLYGIDSAFKENSPLQTVTSLKTSISQIKQIPAGDTIGYGRAGKMPDGGTIATVKIGYADGYSRALGNGNGKMIVGGKVVPTIGKICMDMCMLDITGIQAAEGDEVIVFNDVIKVEDIAFQLHTIPYEVLTGISQRVKRIYYYE